MLLSNVHDECPPNCGNNQSGDSKGGAEDKDKGNKGGNSTDKGNKGGKSDDKDKPENPR